MRRVGKGFSGAETPLFEGMLVAREITKEEIAEEQVQADDAVAVAVAEDVAEDVANEDLLYSFYHHHHLMTFHLLLNCSKARDYKAEGKDVFNQGRMIDDLDKDEGTELVVDQVKDVDTIQTEGRHATEQAKKQAEIYHLDLDHPSKVLSMQEDDSEVQEVVEVITTAKLITEVVTSATSQVSAASVTISAAKPSIPAAALTGVAAYTRRRKGVIIRDPEEELSSKTPAETPKLKDKGKGILIETPKPMKKKDQIELDVEYARKLHEEINKDHEEINRPQTKSEAHKNMMIYLKNTAGYKLDFFKGMSYNEILPIFQARFDANMGFLFKSREEIEEEDREILKSINETPAQKAAKRRKLNEEAQEVKDIKKHLEVVDDEYDDVFTEATPLARKVPVVDYHIVMINNKPRFKIIKADETHQLYISFITLLKNFDREDLENLWGIVKERFSTSKPSNFSDEYLLTTLKTISSSRNYKVEKEGEETEEEEQGESIKATKDDTIKEVANAVKDVEKAKVDESAQDQGRQAESQAKIYKIDMDHANKVLSMQKDETEPAEVQEVVDVVTTAKLIIEVVTATNEFILLLVQLLLLLKLKDPEEESTTSTIILAETKSKDKGKGILVDKPKPLKKKQQIEQDEQYARELDAELNKDNDWDEAIDHVKRKVKEDPAMKKYQAMKRKPQTKAQARKNMMMYLKNVTGFKLDYFKGMSYEDIRPIFEAKFNSNVAFLLKTKEQIKEDENRALQKINETPAERAAKRRKLDEEVEDLKRHLQIVPNEDDDVYTEATPLTRNVPVVDYEIIEMNNKPYYKIIRADGTHQLYISFLTLLRNFDREDLEALWNLVKERFSTAKPKNFSDDFLLTTLGAMF
nr:hypothetical protein [Tanacetum cinerariifolium]